MKKWTLLVLVTAILALVPLGPVDTLLASSTLYACHGIDDGCDGCPAGQRCASEAEPRTFGTCCVWSTPAPTCIPEGDCDYELSQCSGFCDPIVP
jgi:hypothetical protein